MSTDPQIDVQFKVSGNIEEAMKSMAKAMERIAKRSEKARQTVDGNLNKSIKNVNKTVKLAVPSFNNFAQSIFKMTVASKGLAAGMAVLRSPVDAFTFALDATTDTFAELDKELANFRSIASPTERQFKAITKEIEKFGKETPFTAKQIATASTELARLGKNTDDVIGILPGAINLAIASQTELSEAAKVSAVAVNQFGMEAKDSIDVANVMTASFSRSALNMDKFANSMSFVGPVAAKTGVSFEETSAALATLADAGISGSKAGTGLRQILLQLSMSSSKAGKELKRLGVDASATLTEKVKALGAETLGAEKAFDLFGKTALPAALTLFNAGDAMEWFTKNLDRGAVEGFAASIAAIQLDTLDGDMKILNSKMEAFKKSIGEAFDPEVRDAVKILGESIDRMLETVRSRQEDLRTFAKVFTRLAQAAGWAGEAVTNLAADWGELLDATGTFDSVTIEGITEEYKRYEAILKRISDAKKSDNKEALVTAETERDLLAKRLNNERALMELIKVETRLIKERNEVAGLSRKGTEAHTKKTAKYTEELEKVRDLQKQITSIVVGGAIRSANSGKTSDKPKVEKSVFTGDEEGLRKTEEQSKKLAKLLLSVQERYNQASAELVGSGTNKKLQQLKDRFEKEKKLVGDNLEAQKQLQALFDIESTILSEKSAEKERQRVQKETQELLRIKNESGRKELELERLKLSELREQELASYSHIDEIRNQRISIADMQRNQELEKLRQFKQQELDILVEGSDKYLALEDQIGKKRQVIDEKYAKSTLAVDKASFEAKMKLSSEYLGAASAAFGVLRDIYSKNKELAATGAVVDTAAGVASMLNPKIGGPPPLNYINAGIVGAAGAVEIAKIQGQSFNNGGIVQGRGSGVRDMKEPTYLTPGEGILRRDVANQFGQAGINGLNDRNAPTNTITNSITFSPVIQAGSKETGVVDSLRNSYVEFFDFLSEYQEKGMVVF